MNLTIICIGKLKESYWRDAVAEYVKRLGRYCTLAIDELKEEKLKDHASAAEEMQVINAEGKNILRKIKGGSYVIALDVKGKMLSSEDLAGTLSELSVEGKSDLTFIIGGSLGLSSEVLSRADLRLSFSKMTFPHQMMRVVLLEQIYRAYKINKNEVYHK